ncbi:MAG: hypothetical protein LBG67_04465, partial [Campylobacteraceae bacterium]|nr:hypothetical protein [Campylobacteraceae bacterium]
MKKAVLISLFLVFTTLFADVNSTNFTTDSVVAETEISNIKNKLSTINETFKNSIWMTRYENNIQFEELSRQLETIENDLKWLRLDTRGRSSSEKIDTLTKEQNALIRKIEPLNEYKDLPFLDLLHAPEILEVPKVSNPFALANGFSYIRQLKHDSDDFQKTNNELKNLISQLKAKEFLLKQLRNLYVENGELDNEIVEIQKNINEFETAYDIATTSFSVYEKKVNESINKATLEIKSQTKHAFTILTIIISIILVSFVIKIIL